MKIRKERILSVFARWSILLLILVVFLFLLIYDVGPLIFTYAKSRAETIVLDAANTAVLNVLNENDIVYSDVSNVSRNSNGTITGIEIDTVKVNRLKSLISNEITDLVAKDTYYSVKIPIGTLLGNEYTTGYGPRVTFKMQLTETAILNFKSVFEDAGINAVLHQIIINIDISVNVLMMGYSKGFSVSTSAIAAETVIAGEIPDSFTEVEEHPGDDIADEIFNYADVN